MTHGASADTTAFVVAGGQSRRMGRDKALLPWNGGTLLGHALSRLRAVTGDVRILCGPEPRYAQQATPQVTDAYVESGPLVGIASGLRATVARLGLFLAVDLPHVPVELLRFLVSAATDADAVVPISPAGPEPLCAAYGQACLAPIEAVLARGELKMTSFWPDVRVRTLAPELLASFGDPGALFANLNAPEDYERERARRG